MIQKFTRHFAAAALAFMAAMFAGCERHEIEEAPAEDATVYQVKGVVHKIKAEDQVIVIDHEEIPGYMKAMVMPFKVKETGEFKGIQPRDRIEFDYIVAEDGSSWIEKLKVIETEKEPSS